jgi:Bacterial archaeo-eukaryotic release factor family 3
MYREVSVRAAEAITAQDVVTFEDVALLARAGGPCITAILAIPNPLETAARFKSAIRAMEERLKRLDFEEAEMERFIRPVRDLAARGTSAGVWATSIVLYCSPGIFRCFLPQEPARESISLENRFQLRPLLSALAKEQRFNVLGLSQRNIRLLRCTPHHAEEVDLKGHVPQDFRLWMGTWKPDHLSNNLAFGGPSMGSAKGVLFTTSRDREREDRYLAHFFAEVDRGIKSVLGGGAGPLVLAGVEEDVAIYRRVSAYPRLLEKAVLGATDSMVDHVLHQRAREVAAQHASEALGKSLTRFERYRDSPRVSSDARRIIPAAIEGRVSDLLFSSDAELRGRCLENPRRVQMSDNGEDLLNTAALQTIHHGGCAFALHQGEMPAPAEVLGVFRY